MLACLALAACGGARVSASAPASAPAPVCPSAKASAPDLAWLVAPDTRKLVRVEIESRAGYGADFVHDELDFVVQPTGDSTATWTRTTVGLRLGARASSLRIPRALSTALLEAIAGARPRGPVAPGRVVVSASDVHRRFEVRVRDAGDVRHVDVFTDAGADWRLRADGAAVTGELEPETLATAFEAVRARLVAPAE